jgi:hypothetical protein
MSLLSFKLYDDTAAKISERYYKGRSEKKGNWCIDLEVSKEIPRQQIA